MPATPQRKPEGETLSRTTQGGLEWDVGLTSHPPAARTRHGPIFSLDRCCPPTFPECFPGLACAVLFPHFRSSVQAGPCAQTFSLFLLFLVGTPIDYGFVYCSQVGRANSAPKGPICGLTLCCRGLKFLMLSTRKEPCIFVFQWAPQVV